MSDGADVSTRPSRHASSERPTAEGPAGVGDALDALLRCALRLVGAHDGHLAIGRRGGPEWRARVGTPPPAAFCQACRAAGGRETPCVLADAAGDDRFAGTAPNAPRFFARQPIRLPTGQRLGELCLTAAAAKTPGECAAIEAVLEDVARVAGELVAGDIARSRHHATAGRAPDTTPPDPLTGLVTRATIRARLVDFLTGAESRRRVAVHIIGIDRFHEINEDLGHANGDEVLRLIARRLARQVRAGDVIARLGGDEFAVLQLDPDHQESTDALARRLLRVVRTPVHLPAGAVRVRASIGTAVAPEDGDDPDSLPANANLAMRRAKAAGGDRALHFDARADPATRMRRHRRRDLATAIDMGDIDVRYQPQVALGDGAVIGAEALVRWFPRSGGEVPPDEFIPLAEESGLVVPLGRDVLRRACTEAAGWAGGGRVAVNLSPVQLAQDDVVGLVERVLAETGLPAPRLELEVTENALHGDVDLFVDRLAALRRLGVSTALDDFGTGFSSLAMLWRLPIDALKLDRAFVRDVDFDPKSVEILAEILAMARHLGLTTVAEGVETARQRELLIDLGCDVGQGFLFGPAAAAAEVTAVLSGATRFPPAGGA